MKRFVLLFLTAVLCFSLLVVPAFAEETYRFSFDISSNLYVDHAVGLVLPEGKYNISFNVITENGLFSAISTSPVYVSYPFFNDGFWSSPKLTHDFCLDAASSSFDLVFDHDNSSGRIFVYFDDQVLSDGDFSSCSEVFIVATPVSSVLSDVVDETVYGEVFTEILSILPAVLGVLVAFIAIRKGVSFTFSFVSEA